MTKDEALKLALSTLNEVRQETFRLMRDGQTLYAEDKVWSTITAIKEALAQPKQEPVAFICEFYADEGHPFVSFEPVTHGTNTPLYTTPPQRTWVGLTAKEKHEFRYSHMTTADLIDAIEAKLKEKNDPI